MAKAKTITIVYIYKTCVLVFAVVAYLYLPGVQDFFRTGITYLQYRDFERLRQFILAYGLWAPVTSIALMVIQSLVPFVPGVIITITNAWIFGWQYGAIYSWIGALLGAILDFGVARWYGRPVVERFVNVKYINIIDIFLKKHGMLAVFITRLTPVIPFKVVSYSAGLTSISICQFTIATAIGQAPAIVLYSMLGHNITRSIRVTFVITSFLIVICAFIYYYREEIERRFFSDKG